MVSQVSKKLQLKESWIWEDEVSSLVKTLISGKTLNVPCGTSLIGDVRADIDSTHNPDVICDLEDLPFESNSFDTVVSDPPWKIGYFHRMSPFFECVRICKVGGGHSV